MCTCVGRILTTCLAVALAFDEQVMQDVPADDAQDLTVDCIVTPTQILGPHTLLCRHTRCALVNQAEGGG